MGSTVSTDIVPKTLDAISSNRGKSLQISVALNNQGSGSIASVGAVLRVDVKELCKGGNACSGNEPGVIYFPVSGSEQVVESFGTINIRESIETNGSPVPMRVGCTSALPSDSPMKLETSQAGFSTLDKAIDYVSGDKKTIGTDKDKAPGVLVTTGDVLCARDLGIFAGEEITLTVIATTTSGDTIERIIPLTVR